MSTLKDFIKRQIDLFNLFLPKKLRVRTLRNILNNNELKQQVLLVAKLLNINQNFKLFISDQSIDYKNMKTALGARYRKIRLKLFKGFNNIHVIYRGTRLKNPLDTNLFELTELVKIYIMAIESEKNKNFILIDHDLVGEIIDKFSTINEVRIKPLYMRKYMEKSREKVTKMRILIGGEIGGIDGLYYIVLEGTDVIRGVENFYRRYKSQTLRFHMIGALNEIAFENGLTLSSDGRIRVVSAIDLLTFLEIMA